MAKEAKNTFVLNDETKVNSYGFRTLNKGIDLKRFKKNPVILNAHNSWNNSAVIGKWANIRIEESKLLADAVFDEGDEDAMKIAGKVERGFLKGCSMGINPNRDSFEMEPSGAYVLKKSELMEASIVSIPSNANAVKLYAATGEVIEQEDIQLSLDALFKPETNKEQMNKLVLSVAALTALSLQNTEDSAAVALAVDKIVNLNAELVKENEALKAKVDSQLKSRVDGLINQAVVEGKLTAETKEAWHKLAMDDFDTAEKTLATMQGKKSLSATIDNEGGDGSTEVTMDSFQKLSAEEQLSFKEDNPEKYAKLFS